MSGSVVHWSMRSPLYVRSLTAAERAALEAALHSAAAFRLRRAQILLTSAQWRVPIEIAATLGCGQQTVRNVLHAFNDHGLTTLQRESSRPKSVQPLFDEARTRALRDLLHRSPRDFDHPTSVWTLDLAAQVAYSEGLTPYQVSHETIRQALLRLGVRWRRAKHWITSPDPEYAKKTDGATG